jgi:hypothetical protein
VRLRPFLPVGTAKPQRITRDKPRMENTKHPALRCVGISIDSLWSGMAVAMARRLATEYGAEVHLYVQSDRERVGFQHLLDVGIVRSIVDSNILPQALNASNLEDHTVIERARAFESRIGVTYNQLTFGHRHLGRGYNTATFRQPRSLFFRNVTYTQMLHGYSEQLAFWENEIKSKDISLFLLGRHEVAFMCRALGIPYRGIDTARYEDYWLWTFNSFYFSPMVERSYHELRSWSQRKIHDPYAFIAGSFNRMYDGMNPYSVAKLTIWSAITSLNARWRHHHPGHIGNFWQRILTPLNRYRDFKRMTGPSTVRLSYLKGRPFVFFPIHKEPEFGLHLISPEYFNQLALITSISRDLPAGVLLAVKEHPRSLGVRSDIWYDKISDLKNVVFLDLRERGIDVAREADATVAITGTAGFEAAIQGRPVISFGRHCMYSVLPHVLNVTDEAQIRGYLDRIFSGEFDMKRCRRLGDRFIQALVENSFDLKDLGRQGKFYDEIKDVTILDAVFARLIGTLDYPDDNVVRKPGQMQDETCPTPSTAVA